MPPKKKKGKGSKLARMSEEEKLRYLQHRAEIELEAKRRKQQLIAAFTKNKLKREEAFSRLNVAKINEQWRFQLRQIKCKELYDNLEYLWKYFDTALRAKNVVIDQLYEKLNIADTDHRKLQASHIKMIDEYINCNRTRLDRLYQRYMMKIQEIQIEELSDIDHKKKALLEECNVLEMITYAQILFNNEKLIKSKVMNAQNTNTIEYSREENKVYIEKEIGSRINNLRSTLNNIIIDYHNETKDKRKHHDSLIQQDIVHQDELSCYPGLQSKLSHTIESLEYRENVLKLTHKNNVLELETHIDMTNRRIFELRQDIRMNQTRDEIQLKKQTIISINTIEHLKKLKEKSVALVRLTKKCTDFERLLSIINEYSIYCNDNAAKNSIFCAIVPYDKLEKFWQQYNYINTENTFMKTGYNRLMIENTELRNCLRSYLTIISKMANTRS